MASLALLTLWAVSLAVLGTGFVLAFRADIALALQRRYAESLSSVPPSENPEHYEDTREYRRWTFRFGGTVLLIVGTLLLAVAVYATVFAESFPG